MKPISKLALFRTTGWRLTLLNAAVLSGLLFSILGALYLIEVVTTNAELKDILTQTAARELAEDPTAALQSAEAQTDPPHHPFSPAALQAFFVLVDPARQVHRGAEYQLPGLPEQGALHQVLTTGASDLRDRVIAGYSLRLYTVPVRAGTGPIIGALQVYISLEGRERELHRLLVVSLASGVAGLVVAVLAARFLALRALLPIQRMVSQQEQFVADASHELRTPLALLRADVEILQRSLRRTPPNSTPKTRVRRSGEDKASAAAQQLSTDEGEVLDEIHEELGRMTALVRDLLTLATYDAGTQLPPLSSVSLTPLLVEVTERLQRAIVQAQQRLHLLLPEDGDALVVMGNPEALRRLLLILLTNAIAYTPPGGQIWLQAREVAGKQVEIMVRDTGQGIASEDVPHLFIRFYRAEPARPRQPLITDGEAPGGTGLGLAIAKAIVERHQGTITATSPREGQGSTFAVTFKLARQARDKASTRRSAGKAC